MYRLMLTPLLLLSIAGCDSAASGGSEAPSGESPAPETPAPETPAPTTPETPAPDPDPAPVVPESTGAIDSNQDFVFASTRTLFVDFDIPITEDGYLSVCSEYIGAEGGYEIDLDSCLVRSPTVNGVYQGSISVTNEVEALVAVLYFYDETASPLFREFDLQSNQSVLEWN